MNFDPVYLESLGLPLLADYIEDRYQGGAGPELPASYPATLALRLPVDQAAGFASGPDGIDPNYPASPPANGIARWLLHHLVVNDLILAWHYFTVESAPYVHVLLSEEQTLYWYGRIDWNNKSMQTSVALPQNMFA